jgi:hypothetical protein
MKINEFNDLDIPEEILPKPDFDVPSDLLVFMRNDPMFYRKTFFPAVEAYKANKKNVGPIKSMIGTGLNEYCKKFNIQNPKEELLNDGDVVELARTIIQDIMSEK